MTCLAWNDKGSTRNTEASWLHLVGGSLMLSRYGGRRPFFI